MTAPREVPWCDGRTQDPESSAQVQISVGPLLLLRIRMIFFLLKEVLFCPRSSGKDAPRSRAAPGRMSSCSSRRLCLAAVSLTLSPAWQESVSRTPGPQSVWSTQTQQKLVTKAEMAMRLCPSLGIGGPGPATEKPSTRASANPGLRGKRQGLSPGPGGVCTQCRVITPIVPS